MLSLTPPPLQVEVRALAQRSDELVCMQMVSLLALLKPCACNDMLGVILVNGGMFGAEKRGVVMRCLCFSLQQGEKPRTDFTVCQLHTTHWVARKPFYPPACF